MKDYRKFARVLNSVRPIPERELPNRLSSSTRSIQSKIRRKEKKTLALKEFFSLLNIFKVKK